MDISYDTFESGDHLQHDSIQTVSSCQGKENPLLNSVVLRRFFQVVPLSHLKNFRLVCKLWWEESLARWRDEVWVVLGDNEDNDRSAFHPNSNFLSMGLYFQMLSAPSDPFFMAEFPFQNYVLHNWELRLRRRATQLKFWKRFGHLVKQLEIRYSTVLSHKAFRRILFELTPNLQYLSLNENYYECRLPTPILSAIYYQRSRSLNVQSKLKELKVSLTLEYFDRYTLPFTWIVFLTRFPNIEILSLKNLCFERPYLEVENLLESIKIIRRGRPFRNQLVRLRELNILDVQEKPLSIFPLSTLSLMEQVPFPLTSLFIDIGSKTVWSDLNRILVMYSKTIRKLVLFRENEPDEEPYLYFPFGVVFDTLRELRLVGSTICANFHFLQFTPCLKRLQIGYFDDDDFMSCAKIQNGNQSQIFRKMCEGTDFHSLERVTLQYMETLLVADENWSCERENADAIHRMMPNLKLFGKRR